MKTKGWGFDLTSIDSKVRPQDDFYHYASGNWLRKNPIPQNESRWGTFSVVRYKVDTQLKDILSELESQKKVVAGSPQQMVRDFFRSGMDLKRRNALGLRPLLPFLTSVQELKSHKELLQHIIELHRIGVGVLFNGYVDQDSKKSTRYLLHLFQDGLGMPERDYYLKDDKESKRVRTAYRIHVTKLFRLMGYKPQEATKAMEIVLKLETRLAAASMSKEDRRDADKTYHKRTLRDLSKLAPALDWQRYMKGVGAGRANEFIVMQPEFLAEVSRMLREVPLEEWRPYLAFHGVNDYSTYLSASFVRQNFSFYGTVLGGVKKMRPLWRRVLSVVNGNIGELLGKIYVAKHFTAAAKRKMNLLVDDLFTAYEARLKSLSWMTSATKKKALRKLKAMNRKIGYPDKWRSYTGLVIKADDYLGNATRAALQHHHKEMKKLNGPIDRKEWFMYPQTVNAYFAPNLNDIVFPAGILQPPFFNLHADDALNYGAIGTVIGHEITHGFDDQGSKYDEYGNLKSWWTVEDRKRFEKLANIIVKQYDAYQVADGVHVNGQLTLGENIADLGGLSIALDAYQLQLKRTGRKDIDGFTPEQRFFLGLTLFECENQRPEMSKMQVLTDPHAPSKFRVNGPVANVDAFYEAFKVTKKDKLYREPKIRTTVW